MIAAHFVLAFTLVIAGSIPAVACPSDFDIEFGDGGVATGLLPPGPAYGYDLAMDDSGSIVVAGMFDLKPALFRYTHDGALDTSFGDQGLAQLDVEGLFASVAIDEDGSIVAAGQGPDVTFPHDIRPIVARFDANGRLDPDFGESGTTVSPGVSEGYVHDLLIRSDGMIVVVGQDWSGYSSGIGARPLLFFVTPQGEPATDFGSDGLVQLGDASLYIATSAVEVAGGAIVVFGGKRELNMFVARLTSEGELDGSFGRNGIRSLRSAHRYELPSRIAKDHEGRLYLSGAMTRFFRVTLSRAFVRRLLPDGRRDPSYGDRGRRLIRFGQVVDPIGLAVAGNGETMVAGNFWNGGSFVWRLTPDGDRDPAFGKRGLTRVRVGDVVSKLSQVARQDDGRILASGGSDGSPLLIRFEGGTEVCPIP